MSAYFSKHFLKQLPNNIWESIIHEQNDYSHLRDSISNGFFTFLADGKVATVVLDAIRDENKDLYKIFESKILAEGVVHYLPLFEDNDTSTKEGLNESIAKGENVHSVFFENIEDYSAKNKLTNKLNKPVFLDGDLKNKKIGFLFKNESITLDLNSEFDWHNFILPYLLPFHNIRILDPYLFKNILRDDRAFFGSFLESITSASKFVEIEIISDIKHCNRDEVFLKNTFQKFIAPLKTDTYRISLRTQNRTASGLFHPRVVWTDFWLLKLDSGFSFLKKSRDKNKTIINKSNPIDLYGRFAGEKTLWNDVSDKWELYLKNSRPL